MRRILRWAGRAVLAIVALVLGALAILYVLSERELRRTFDVSVESIPIPTDAASIERGRHIAMDVSGCRDCHGPDFGGNVFIDGGLVFAKVAASNLTRGRGGIGSRYTDTDWVRALRHGLRPDNTPLVIMPAEEFSKWPASETGALIAYLKTLPPVDRDVPKTYVGPIGRWLVLKEPAILPARTIDHAKAAPDGLPSDPVAMGDHLTSVAGCKACHNPDFTGGQGPEPGAANLTPIGIGQWTKEDFFRTLRTGRTPDRRTLSESMPRAFGNMTDAELDAIWAYLKTLPPKGQKSPRQNGGGA